MTALAQQTNENTKRKSKLPLASGGMSRDEKLLTNDIVTVLERWMLDGCMYHRVYVPQQKQEERFPGMTRAILI